MIIEMKIARGTGIWIDGQPCHHNDWEIDESNGLYRMSADGEPLTFILADGTTISLEWIDFGLPDYDWYWEGGAGDRGLTKSQQRGYSMPKRMTVKFAGIEPVEATDLVIVILGTGEDIIDFIKGNAPGEGINMGIKLENGEWLELDETIAFVKAEVQL